MITVNHLPVRTWNRLLMNEADIENDFMLKEHEFLSKAPERVMITENTASSDKEVSPLNAIKTGLGSEFDKLLKDSALPVHRIVTSEKNGSPLYLDFNYDTSVSSASLFEYHIKENAALTVIQYFAGKDTENTSPAKSGTALVQNKVYLEKGAFFKLIQVQTLSDEFEFFNDTGVTCEDDASASLIQLTLGGGKVYQGAYSALSGYRSSFGADIAYSLSGTRSLDMNYVADHTGKKTTSRMGVSGILRDNARKLFRGTIDFHKGCAGAKGAELEEVLLLDDEIVNQTIPLILCDEEDVEGSHGASIGRLDEGLLFYLKSRGISEDEAYEMISRAKIDAVVNKIEDEETKRRIGEFLGE